MQTNSSSTENNTYLFDTKSISELFRLISLDRTITKLMGGPLAEQADVESLRLALDLACGAGGWALELAHDFPQCEVAGIDISEAMINYARATAVSRGVHNASFEVMDILQPLEFSDNTFDLVNARFITWFISKNFWPTLLQECMRILQPGGLLRLTETDGGCMTTSPAYERLHALTLQATWTSGHSGFSLDGQRPWITHMLSTLLRQAGFHGVRIKAHALDVSAGQEGWECFYQQCVIIFAAMRPVYIKMGLLTEDEFEALHRQMEIEVRSDDFSGVWYHLTAWGRKALDDEQG